MIVGCGVKKRGVGGHSRPRDTVVGMRRLGWLTAILAGCSPGAVSVTDGTSSMSGAGASTTMDWATTTSTDGSTTTVESDTSSGANGGPGFIVDPDGGPQFECDLWTRECPRGTKCMPSTIDDGHTWNTVRCTPLARDPAQVDEPCTVEGSSVSGIDDCEAHAMCWYVDGETLMGTCVAMCTGSARDPTCEDGSRCSIRDYVILCPGTCDPLLQDCPYSMTACYPTDDGFYCVADASGDDGELGDACEYINVCAPGLFCATAQVVPGCATSGCCAAFCDLSTPGASEACAAAAPGTACVPWYSDGEAPADARWIGVCVEP